MSKQITNAQDFAKEYEICTGLDFFSMKELKSLADSIDYSYRFFNISRKLRLKEEQVYLCSFLGYAALVFMAKEGSLKRHFAEECAALYIEKLTCRWLLNEDVPKSKQRVAERYPEKLADAYFNLNNAMNGADAPDTYGEIYMEIINNISIDFYQSLFQAPCDEMNKLFLFRRFNLYFGHFIEIVQKLTQQMKTSETVSK